MVGHDMEIPGDVGIVARLCQACIDIIKTMTVNGAEDQSFQAHIVPLMRIQHSLVLWDIDHSVANGNLDSILQTSRGLQKATLVPLRSIIRILAFDMLRSVPLRTREQILEQRYEYQLLLDESEFSLCRDDDSDEEHTASEPDEDASETTDSEESGIHVILHRLSNLVRCLFDLGGALESPAPDPEYLYPSGTTEPSLNISPYQAYAQKIRDRFPSAPKTVIEYLGQANLKRYQRIMQRIREEEEEEAQVRDTHASPTDIHSTAGATEIARNSSAWAWLMDAEFRDSALGSSIPTGTSRSRSSLSEASSTISAMAGEAWKSFPRLTDDAKHGKPFQCDACGRILVISKTRQWNKHLISDLLPYNCIVPDCSFGEQPFSNKHLWTQHMLLDHETSEVLMQETCLLCESVVTGGTEVLLHHISRHLEEISAAALPRNASEHTGDDEDSEVSASSHASSAVPASEYSDHEDNGPVNEEESTGDTGFNEEAPITYGYLFNKDRKPKEMLEALLGSIFNYAVAFIEDPADVPDGLLYMTPYRTAALYRLAGLNYDSLFLNAPNKAISYIWEALGVQHVLLPGENDFQPPSIPGLTRNGFIRWQSIQILLEPEEHVPFMQHAALHWGLRHPRTGQLLPRDLPANSFPKVYDPEIDRWHKECADHLRNNYRDPSRTRMTPLTGGVMGPDGWAEKADKPEKNP